MDLRLPESYRNQDVESCYISFNPACPDWCAVSNAILKIADNTYQTNGSTVPTPATPAPVGFVSEAQAIAGGVLVGEVYYNTVTGAYDVVC
jgi:hypothetical protein